MPNIHAWADAPRHRSILQTMPQPRLLGLEVLAVVLARLDLDGDLFHDMQAVSLNAINLLGVVGHDADILQAQIAEDLAADAVVAFVGGKSQSQIRIDRIESLLLKLVCVQLVRESDSAPFLAQIDQHTL